MVSPVPSDSIDEQAARWAAVTLDDAISTETRGALENWLAVDRRHRGAYLRARAGLILLEDAVQGRPVEREGGKPIAFNDDDVSETVPANRTWLPRNRLVTGAIAASLTLLFGISMSALWSIKPKTAQEALADLPRRALRLADGSIATLGQGAQIDFSMQDGTRKVVLVGGEASFQVAKDRAHPFVVQSGDVYAQATGTVYSVRRVGDKGGAVHVDEGSVLVWARDDREQAVLLHAGGALTLEPGQQQGMAVRQDARPTAPPPVVAQIALDNVTIAAAAARFNRVNPMQIQIADPAIAETRIVGLFRADDPQHFAKAAAIIASGEVELVHGKIVIKSK